MCRSNSGLFGEWNRTSQRSRAGSPFSARGSIRAKIDAGAPSGRARARQPLCAGGGGGSSAGGGPSAWELAVAEATKRPTPVSLDAALLHAASLGGGILSRNLCTRSGRGRTGILTPCVARLVRTRAIRPTGASRPDQGVQTRPQPCVRPLAEEERTKSTRRRSRRAGARETRV